MKQSAVDYLAEKLLENQTYDREGYVIIDISVEHLEYLVQRAKEMEKEQVINARQSGIDATINGKSISNIDYYNETFKSE